MDKLIRLNSFWKQKSIDLLSAENKVRLESAFNNWLSFGLEDDNGGEDPDYPEAITKLFFEKEQTELKILLILSKIKEKLHDLNGPIQLVVGYSSIIKEQEHCYNEDLLALLSLITGNVRNVPFYQKHIDRQSVIVEKVIKEGYLTKKSIKDHGYIYLRLRIYLGKLELFLAGLKCPVIDNYKVDLNKVIENNNIFIDKLSRIEINEEKVKDDVEIIIRGLKRVNYGIDDVIRIVNGEEEMFTMKVYDLRKITEEVVIDQREIFRGVSIRIKAESIMVSLDKRKFVTSVLENIFANAKKYAFIPGQVKPKIKVEIYKDLDKAVISIRNNGLQIQDSELESIFEKYKRLEGSLENGSGFGLFNAREMVKKFKGKIFVRNWSQGNEKGVEFVIELPVYTGKDNGGNIIVSEFEDSRRDAIISRLSLAVETIERRIDNTTIGLLKLATISHAVSVLNKTMENIGFHIVVKVAESNENYKGFENILGKSGVIGDMFVALTTNSLNESVLVITEIQPDSAYWKLSSKQKRLIKNWRRSILAILESLAQENGIKEVAQTAGFYMKEVQKVDVNKYPNIESVFNEFYSRPDKVTS